MSPEAMLVRLQHLEHLPGKIETLTTAINEMKVEMAKHGVCQSPNLCLQLHPEIVELKRATMEMQMERQQFKGGVRVLNYLAVLVGGASGAIVSWIVSILKHNTP